MTAVTPLSDITQRMPIVGKLKSGKLVPTKSGSKRPAAIDTFRLTTSSRPFAEQFADVYGGTVEKMDNPNSPHKWEVTSEATEVNIALLPNGYSIQYELWSGGGCQRRCNGIQAEVLQTSGPDTVEYVPTPCICDRKSELECSLKSRLTFVLPDLPFAGGLVYESGSKNFAEESQGMLRLIQQMQEAGITRGYLRLEHRRSSGNRKYTIAVVGVRESLEALASGMAGMQSLGRAPQENRPELAAGSAAGPQRQGEQEAPSPPPAPPSRSPSVDNVPQGEGGTIEAEGDTTIVDAEIVEDDDVPPMSDAERAKLRAKFHGILKGLGLDYKEQVRPWMQAHYDGRSLSELDPQSYRSLLAKLDPESQGERQENRRRFKVAVEEWCEANDAGN